MESNKQPTWPVFYKDRSFKACIADAWLAFALQPKAYLRFLLPPLLLAGLCATAFSFIALYLSSTYALPLYMLALSGVDPHLLGLMFSPPASAWLLLGGALLSLAAAFFLWSGASAAQIRALRQNGALPAKGSRALYGEICRSGGRALLLALLVGAALLIIGLPVGFLCLKYSGWFVVIFILAFIYLTITGIIASTYYLVERRSLGASLRAAFGRFLRQFGGFLLIAVLMLIPIWIVGLMAGLPLLTLQLSYHAAAMSRLMGDAVATPGYVPALYFLAGIVSIAFVSFLHTILFWAFSYRMASSSFAEQSGESPAAPR